jgi:predicted RNA binding protein YcfA (HicA-like mRNA interferase family)
MKVYIDILQSSADVEERLREKGWCLQRERGHGLLARHPDVTTQSQARQELLGAGLLTSSAVRIEFPLREVPAAGSGRG